MSTTDPSSVTANVTEVPIVHDGHGSSPPTPILFAFVSCACGALVRTVLKRTRIRLPYTVVVLMLGLLFGFMAKNIDGLSDYTSIANMDPHTILHVFLPVLIFESAFAMESHMFLKSLTQILVLSLPGLTIAAFMTATLAKYIFDYGWGWTQAMMFGAIISATDPVSVVGLLKELGTSKHTTTLIEGESLLNDGAAIVLFEVFQHLSIPGKSMGALDIIQHFMLRAVVGPLFGFTMAKLTVFWLVNIFNDALTEITITLASTYITFYIGEEMLKVSGVMAVVVLGITLNAERTSISPEVDAFLHRFWQMLAYLADTLIFMLVGVVIMEKAINNVHGEDYVYCISLFIGITFIRACTLILLSPILKRTGYGLTWKGGTLMVWGALRGAVGLAMALIAFHKTELDPTMQMQNRILFHCAGIVMLTLFINATTVSLLLKLLGMSDVSVPKRMTMAGAVRQLDDVTKSSLATYKTDRFLADADWDIVYKYIQVENPYEMYEDEEEVRTIICCGRSCCKKSFTDTKDSDTEEDSDTEAPPQKESSAASYNELRVTSTCPNCETKVLNEPSNREFKEMREEARLRLLKAQKISYWKQFEHGMLSREAIRKLTECVDTAVDQEDQFIEICEIKQSWQITGVIPYLKNKLEQWYNEKPDHQVIPVPKYRCLSGCYKVARNPGFEIVLNVVIFGNMIALIVEMVLQNTARCSQDYYKHHYESFRNTNYFFIAVYTIEAVIKIMGLRIYYFKSWWNLFDFAILLMCFVDTSLDVTIFQPEDSGECDDSSVTFSPSILRVVKAIRFLRLLRTLRLIKGMLPHLIGFLTRQINKKLRFGYDVGKGYVFGEEEVHNLIDYLVDNEKIAKEMKLQLTQGRIEIIKELGLLQRNHPGIAVSIKTQQASRRILNNLRDKVRMLRGEGVLDDGEASKLELMVEVRMKKLLKIPATIAPPPPEKIIGNLSWCMGDELLIEYIKHNATLVPVPEGERLSYIENDPKGGIYVIISGLVKVEKMIDHKASADMNMRKFSIFPTILPSEEDVSAEARKSKDDDDVEIVYDYLTTGSVLGETALLTKRPNRRLEISCDTSVQMYHIPYDAIQAALELFTEEPSLEFRLWRVCAIRLSCAVLKLHTYYRGWTLDKIKLHLENSIIYWNRHEMTGKFDIREEDYEVFDMSSMTMSDIVLIHGVAISKTTGEKYFGPCLIPKKVEKLALIPGQTDCHVLVMVPREANFNMMETSRHQRQSSQHALVPMKHRDHGTLEQSEVPHSDHAFVRQMSSLIGKEDGLHAPGRKSSTALHAIRSNEKCSHCSVEIENEVVTSSDAAPPANPQRPAKVSFATKEQPAEPDQPRKSAAFPPLAPPDTKSKILPVNLVNEARSQMSPVEEPEVSLSRHSTH